MGTETGKHTPGPWRTEQRGDEWRVMGAHGAGPYRVLSIELGVIPSDIDARLIAAAPELLEALRELLAERYALEEPEQFDASGNWTSDSPASVKARLAIAKATGGEGGGV